MLMALTDAIPGMTIERHLHNTGIIRSQKLPVLSVTVINRTSSLATSTNLGEDLAFWQWIKTRGQSSWIVKIWFEGNLNWVVTLQSKTVQYFVKRSAGGDLWERTTHEINKSIYIPTGILLLTVGAYWLQALKNPYLRFIIQLMTEPIFTLQLSLILFSNVNLLSNHLRCFKIWVLVTICLHSIPVLIKVESI